MSTRILSSNISRLVIGAMVAVSSAACGSELLRTGRSPMYLVVSSVTGGPEGDDEGSIMFSDVLTNGGIVNDNVRINLRLEAKNAAATTSGLNAVTMTRYEVVFKRADNRNRPGVDVPHGISGALAVTMSIDAPSAVVAFALVRHQAKLEPPLMGMRNFGQQVLISAIAEITLYGRDQNGNELMVTTQMDVHFGDFADDEDA